MDKYIWSHMRRTCCENHNGCGNNPLLNILQLLGLFTLSLPAIFTPWIAIHCFLFCQNEYMGNPIIFLVIQNSLFFVTYPVSFLIIFLKAIFILTGGSAREMSRWTLLLIDVTFRFQELFQFLYILPNIEALSVVSVKSVT